MRLNPSWRGLLHQRAAQRLGQALTAGCVFDKDPFYFSGFMVNGLGHATASRCAGPVPGKQDDPAGPRMQRAKIIHQRAVFGHRIEGFGDYAVNFGIPKQEVAVGPT